MVVEEYPIYLQRDSVSWCCEEIIGCMSAVKLSEAISLWAGNVQVVKRIADGRERDE